ncbi:Heterogeneous nuclear ribonucleoprotein L [Sciurus carolinensis]|uniref:Heterogeneous nuclear ribonucleoprotein L n=1 Tax=Sciurus carolinensis TaxID=30640 RepID=A0AA41N5Q5_SCICA|nr:Heterogeneous nuclear ribonucleoprotein L [Sciurus carolinensis]
MVEFNSVQSAQGAKATLNGADISSGCCTLKIEYAEPTCLNVLKNDQDTWDYTNPNLSGQGDPGSNPNKCQREPPAEYGEPHVWPHSDSPVLMVYGLDQSKMNGDRVFNVFCLYGNVEKVKFMKSKPGAAMVEMADGYAVD